MTSEIGKAGFTLIEVCVTLAILGIVLSVGWPSFRRYSQRMIARARAYELAERLASSREQVVLSGGFGGYSLKGRARVSEGKIPMDPTFFPDGTAEPFSATFPTDNGAIKVNVNEIGEVTIHEL